jgi:hypothetical protein
LVAGASPKALLGIVARSCDHHQTERAMAWFMTIGYGDQAGYDRTPDEARRAAHEHDSQLVERGVVMGVARQCVHVRNPEGHGLMRRDGPFMRVDLPLAGFAMIEAGSMDEAVEIASKSPCAVAHGVVEVWAVDVARA